MILTFILRFIALRRSWVSQPLKLHGWKGDRRKQQQAAGLVSARVTERAERLEREKAAVEERVRHLTTPTLVVYPPQHILQLAPEDVGVVVSIL